MPFRRIREIASQPLRKPILPKSQHNAVLYKYIHIRKYDAVFYEDGNFFIKFEKNQKTEK